MVTGVACGYFIHKNHAFMMNDADTTANPGVPAPVPAVEPVTEPTPETEAAPEAAPAAPAEETPAV